MHGFGIKTALVISLAALLRLATPAAADRSSTPVMASLDGAQLALPADFFGEGTTFTLERIPVALAIAPAGSRDLSRPSSSPMLGGITGTSLVEVALADGSHETWRATVSLRPGSTISAATTSARFGERASRIAIQPVIHFERIDGGPRTVRVLQPAAPISTEIDEPSGPSTADIRLLLAAPRPLRAARGPASPGSPSSPTSEPCLAASLATGFDEGTGSVIPVGGADAEWQVVVDPIGATPEPRPAGVVTPNPAWDTQPGSAWISADPVGPNGTYIYQYCFCLEAGFTNASVSLDTLSDDAMQGVFLNGTLIGGPTPPAPVPFRFPTFHVETVDQSLFVAGQNCLDVQVDNQFGVVTGLNVTGTVTADDGGCCAP